MLELSELVMVVEEPVCEEDEPELVEVDEPEVVMTVVEVDEPVEVAVPVAEDEPDAEADAPVPVAPETVKPVLKLMLLVLESSTISKLYWLLFTSSAGMVKVAVSAEAGTLAALVSERSHRDLQLDSHARTMPEPGVTSPPWVRRMVTVPLLGLLHVMVVYEMSMSVRIRSFIGIMRTGEFAETCRPAGGMLIAF